VFKSLRTEIGLGIGVIDIKRTEVESAEEVARAIEQAEKALGAGRLSYVHPDCGFWMLKRSMADGKMKALVAGRDLYEGRSAPQVFSQSLPRKSVSRPGRKNLLGS
jgi:5-methyltetrahydropteroyltriglutamate--homocysteine methyltransferase